MKKQVKDTNKKNIHFHCLYSCSLFIAKDENAGMALIVLTLDDNLCDEFHGFTVVVYLDYLYHVPVFLGMMSSLMSKHY